MPPPANAGPETIAVPDFATVTTRAAANRLVRAGALVRIHLFPTELGGSEDSRNIGYVTPAAAVARRAAIDAIARRFQRDEVDRMHVEPEYRGSSIVPTRIVMIALRSDDDTRFTVAIHVW